MSILHEYTYVMLPPSGIVFCRNIEYLNFHYFPVLPEDYEFTGDRPKCEVQVDHEEYILQGSLVHCNVRLKSLARMEHVIRNALHHWENAQ